MKADRSVDEWFAYNFDIEINGHEFEVEIEYHAQGYSIHGCYENPPEGDFNIEFEKVTINGRGLKKCHFDKFHEIMYRIDNKIYEKLEEYAWDECEWILKKLT